MVNGAGGQLRRILSRCADLDSRDGFGIHQSTILGTLRCSEQHKTWDG